MIINHYHYHGYWEHHCRGFVSSKAMAKMGEVEVGKVMWCVVTRVEAGVRSLTPIPGKVWSQECANPTIHNLYPGTKVKGKVEELVSNVVLPVKSKTCFEYNCTVMIS